MWDDSIFLQQLGSYDKMKFQANKKISWVLLALWFIAAPVFATLNLELTQGVSSAIPIAIVPFKDGGSLPTNISSVVSNDLQDSGQFRVFAESALQQFPSNPLKVDYSYWKAASASYLVVGNITPSANHNQVTVDFSLLNVYQGNMPQDHILISQQYTVPQNALRQLAHHISDVIYQKLTGVRGIFTTKIAYVLTQKETSKKPVYQLIVSDMDGYNPQKLLTSNEPIMSPAWSPNGQKIAYVSFEGGRAQIYVQTVATGQRTLVSRYPGINGAPAWSPDGTKLAVVLSITGNPKIYIYNLETKQIQQVTHGGSIDTEPSWSPDGKNLIFTSDRGGSPQIYELNLSSGNIQRLTFDGNYNARASFSPDGKSIVFVHREGNGLAIATENLETSAMTLLTSYGVNKSPSFAPNGKMIIYSAYSKSRGILGIVSSDGSVKLRIPSPDGSVQEPVWSPFLNS